MSDHLVAEGTLTLPYGVVRTLHYGGGEVRLYRNLITQTRQVGKRISRLGREGTLAATEATLLREIDHPNVADIYDVAEVAGSDPTLAIIEMTMPYYEQGSTFDAMERGVRFRTSVGRDLAIRALRGVAHLHDVHQVLHRDLKTPNLLLSGDGSLVKVGDLGEAVRMDDRREAPPLLSPGFWTPPETFTGYPHSVSSDLYSMGMSIGEILSGPIPYDSYDVETVASRLAAGRPAIMPRHAVFAPHVPDSLRRIVRKATRPTPDGRYQSAAEMITALNRARFVDWEWPTYADDSVEYLGTWNGQDLRVRGRRMRNGTWRYETERHYASGWREIAALRADGPTRDQAAELAFRQIDRVLVRV
ncbi:protein kinase domain-containing protein [Nocardioides antri]|uniref:Protein kinase n=1 Tax=Nocardioides antri TaxID=2607659 RepID=A0A5B1M1D6_9ACTN|nr:protein kinase [Nocardioides antri]KAA1426732.1 protein kinase [Nocardioides antri]